MVNTFKNSKISRTSDFHGLLLNLLDKTILERSDKYVALSNLSVNAKKDAFMEKYKKSHTKTINLKYCLQRGTKNLNYLIDHILYQIFKIILSVSYKSMKQ